jgi:hypothetical protein
VCVARVVSYCIVSCCDVPYRSAPLRAVPWSIVDSGDDEKETQFLPVLGEAINDPGRWSATQLTVQCPVSSVRGGGMWYVVCAFYVLRLVCVPWCVVSWSTDGVVVGGRREVTGPEPGQARRSSAGRR